MRHETYIQQKYHSVYLSYWRIKKAFFFKDCLDYIQSFLNATREYFREIC